jgi:RNA polymerase sigma factor (sigma-70 family)
VPPSIPAVQTLADVLYANTTQPIVPEREWAMLVRSIAAGDEAALYRLFERSHPLVFTLLARITSSREAADDLTVDVYDDIRRCASSYEEANGSVLAWIMNLARARAIARLRDRQEDRQHGPGGGLLAIDTPDYRDLLRLREQSRALWQGLAGLSADERGAIEASFFRGCTYSEAAARLRLPVGEIRSRIRSALWKLREVLAPGAPRDASACSQGELACLHALSVLPPPEAAAHELHLESCWRCRGEVDALRPVIDAFVVWPTDILRPPAPLHARIVRRVAANRRAPPVASAAPRWTEPEWEEVAAGISCRLLATDAQRRRVSMLVRLAPGGEYPPHTHAGVEELHLLSGELWIDERKLHPGDYNRAEAGTGDRRVWSATGCTCVLVTSSEDILT